jgi:heterodisulfide reductase subunit A-like polyferredoxin
MRFMRTFSSVGMKYYLLRWGVAGARKRAAQAELALRVLRSKTLAFVGGGVAGVSPAEGVAKKRSFVAWGRPGRLRPPPFDGS